MAFADVNGYRIRYALHGDERAPLVTFVNGLTQNADLWNVYGAKLSERGYRVLAYDMLGQGQSAKPVLGTKLAEHAPILAGLLEHVGAERTHLAGISFGGVIALDFALRYPGRLASLTVMSSFAELTPQLEMLSTALYEGLTQVGLPYMQKLLYPLNMSSAWIEANRARIPEMIRSGYMGNDLYALQNLMESFVDFAPLTPRLGEIRCPALVVNGEYDFFTPRACHELMRRQLPNCRLLLIQRGYHAFTLEMPDIALRQIWEFVHSVDAGIWTGDGTVWVAADSATAAVHAVPCRGDHLRAIPLPSAQQAPDKRQRPPRTVRARPRKALRAAGGA
jgi:pimeloyl-ACP methyl ester carboxylesterase